MQKLLSRINPYKKSILAGSALLLIACVFLLPYFNSPVADVWGYFTLSKKHDFLSYLHLTYTSNTARISQWALIWVGFHLFGMTFTQIYPIVSFATLVLILALILIRSNLAKSTSKALSFSVLAGAAFLCSCPSLLDSFLWLDSNIVHFTSIVFSLLIVLEIITMTKEMNKRQFVIRFIALLVLCFVAQFFSELADIINVSYLGLFCAFLFFRRKKSSQTRLLLKVCFPCLFVLIAGLLVLYYSPARIARSAYNNSSFGLSTIKESIKTYHSFFSHVPVLAYSLIIFAAFAFSNCIKTSILNHFGLLISLLSVVATTFCSFLVICYAQGFAVPRTLTMTAFGFSFSTIYILASIIALAKKRMSNFATIGFFASFIIAAALSTIFVPPYIEKIATRHLLSKQRDINTRAQIESGSEVIELAELPILVYGTAEDFYYYVNPETGEELPIWVTGQYVDYIRGDYAKPEYKLVRIDDYSGSRR